MEIRSTYTLDATFLQEKEKQEATEAKTCAKETEDLR